MNVDIIPNGRTADPQSEGPVITGIDLCCGAGGLTHGLTRGGIRMVAGVDIDPQCNFPYSNNNSARFIKQSVTDLSGKQLAELFGGARLRLMAGCAPCQLYSTYNRNGQSLRQSKKWELVSDFARLARETTPDFVTMENVPQLKNQPVFLEFLSALEDYSVWWDIVECSRFGVPQTRKRLVLIASRLGKVKLVAPDQPEVNCPTVRDTISKLPQLKAGCSDTKDRLHTASCLSDLNLRRIKASKPGGTWRDWDPALVASCHLKSSGKTYPSVYGRMEWDSPAPTITTQCFGYGNGRFGHPEQDRAISLREAALLQTFPENYQFVEPDGRVRFSQLGRLIGNAVPVRIGEVVAESLIDHAREYAE